MPIISSFAERGFLLIPRLFDPALIDRLREEIESQRRQLGEQQRHKVGHRREMLSVRLRGPFLDPSLWANPLLLAIVRPLLDDDIVIDSISVVVAEAGAEEQHHHRDHDRLFSELPLESALPPYAITIMVPLTTFDEDTGTTMLDPGTHHDVAHGEPVAGFVPKGGCYLMDYRLRHWGSANRSASDRPLLAITYARPWFTDCVNYRDNVRLNITDKDALSIPQEHWPLFRRLHPSPYPREQSHKISTATEA